MPGSYAHWTVSCVKRGEYTELLVKPPTKEQPRNGGDPKNPPVGEQGTVVDELNRAVPQDEQELVDDIIVHGWDVYAKGKPKFEDWAREVRKEFGGKAEPHLERIYMQFVDARAPQTVASVDTSEEKATSPPDSRREDISDPRHASENETRAPVNYSAPERETAKKSRRFLASRGVFLGLPILMVIVGYSWFIWPTPYLIVREKDHVFRVNRFAGIREESTDKGWKTKGQLQAEYWSKQAEQQNANQQRELEEKAAQQRKNDQVLEDLKQIKVDEGRTELTKIIIYNPTPWDLGGSHYNTTVEYYTRDAGRDVFLVKYETSNNFMKAYTYNAYDLKNQYSQDLPDELMALTTGTAFTQKVFIQFDTATNRDSGEQVKLKPVFVWKGRRLWTMSPP